MKYQVLPFLLDTPTAILSDNGPEFTSREFNKVLAELGVHHTYTTPYKPTSNGLVERTNRTITELLRNLSASPADWDDSLLRAVTIYNSTAHSELGMSPSQFLLKKEHDSLGAPLLPPTERGNWREGNPSFAPYSVGQKVLRKIEQPGRLLVNKLAERYSGPYLVKRVNDNRVTYVITDEETAREVRAHHTQLRPFHEPPSYIKRHPYFREMKDDPELLVEDVVEPLPTPIFGGGLVGNTGAWLSTDDESSFSGFVESDSGGEDDDLPGCSLITPDPASDDHSSELQDKSESEYFDYMGDREKDLLARCLTEIDGSSNSSEFSGFLLQDPVVRKLTPPGNPSGVLLGDEAIWTVSDIEVDTDNRLMFGPQLQWDDKDWYQICLDSVEVAEEAVGLAEQAISNADLSPLPKSEHTSGTPGNQTGLDYQVKVQTVLSDEPALEPPEEMGSAQDRFMSLSGISGSQSGFEGFRESIGATAQKLANLKRNLDHYVEPQESALEDPDGESSVHEVVQFLPVRDESGADCEGFSERIDVTAQKLAKLKAKVDYHYNRVEDFEARRLENRVTLRSPVGTRSSGVVPDYPRVQLRILEYKLVAITDSEVTDGDV
jgi:hypothetical protein